MHIYSIPSIGPSVTSLPMHKAVFIMSSMYEDRISKGQGQTNAMAIVTIDRLVTDRMRFKETEKEREREKERKKERRSMAKSRLGR